MATQAEEEARAGAGLWREGRASQPGGDRETADGRGPTLGDESAHGRPDTGRDALSAYAKAGYPDDLSEK